MTPDAPRAGAAGRRLLRLASLALLALLIVLTPVRSKPDDDDDDDKDAKENAAAAQPQVFFAEENFDQWVFQNNGTFTDARRRLDQLLSLRLDDVDRVCKLNKAERAKLQLAGRGDIKRFFVLYDHVKQKFQAARNDQQKMNDIWREINPLQTMLYNMFDDSSILGKSVRHALPPEKLALYEAALHQRLMARHRAHVELAVAVLEQNMPLRDAQRKEVIDLLVKVAKLPRKTGNYGYYILMYQMSQLPEEKLKPLFDEAQWKVIGKQLVQFKGWGQWLRQSGQLPDEDDDDKADKADKAADKQAAGK
jgi:hypothetical protein